MELKEGSAGVFEIDANGQSLFSKKAEGRFPRYQEIPTAITMAGLAPA